MGKDKYDDCRFTGTCPTCGQGFLREAIDRLTADFKKAQERIHELTTYGDRVNTENNRLTKELETALSWQHEAVDREEKVISELEQAKRENEIIRGTRNETCETIEKLIAELATERKALELAIKVLHEQFENQNFHTDVYTKYVPDYFRKLAKEG